MLSGNADRVRAYNECDERVEGDIEGSDTERIESLDDEPAKKRSCTENDSNTTNTSCLVDTLSKHKLDLGKNIQTFAKNPSDLKCEITYSNCNKKWVVTCHS